jgi:hypothetical protein
MLFYRDKPRNSQFKARGLSVPTVFPLGAYSVYCSLASLSIGDRSRNLGVKTKKPMAAMLKRWTRYPGNPVIPNGSPGSPDEHFASDPCVLQDGHQWVFYYFGLDARGVARDLAATGNDLFHATKCDRILIEVGPKGSIDSTYAHKPSVIQYQGDLYHFYCAVAHESGPEIRAISVARSKPWS